MICKNIGLPFTKRVPLILHRDEEHSNVVKRNELLSLENALQMSIGRRVSTGFGTHNFGGRARC